MEAGGRCQLSEADLDSEGAAAGAVYLLYPHHWRIFAREINYSGVQPSDAPSRRLGFLCWFRSRVGVDFGAEEDNLLPASALKQPLLGPMAPGHIYTRLSLRMQGRQDKEAPTVVMPRTQIEGADELAPCFTIAVASQPLVSMVDGQPSWSPLSPKSCSRV
jgi:hypothetical protein